MDKKPKRENARSVDTHVGSRIRLRRTMMGLSKRELGEILGVTDGQVDAYESGASRIAARRLVQFAGALGVPAYFFFQGADRSARSERGCDEADLIGAFLSTGDAAALASSWIKLDDIARRAVLTLIQSLAGEASADDRGDGGAAR